MRNEREDFYDFEEEEMRYETRGTCTSSFGVRFGKIAPWKVWNPLLGAMSRYTDERMMLLRLERTAQL